MTSRTNLVNLDAMIRRADFATDETSLEGFETFSTLSIRDLMNDSTIIPNLRKPDFQRETNHWRPEQIVSLLQSFKDGDLIPSIILWRSPTYLFIIDGAHRVSVLRAWAEDDYGDGAISQAYFGYEISKEQKSLAERTRKLVNKEVKSWKHNYDLNSHLDLDPVARKQVNTIMRRALPIQWISGNADKAEKSFFKINAQGTPLDDIEKLILENRKKPVAIAARAVIRAGKGHRYWSSFADDKANEIEVLARTLHATLFDPEINKPIKTLELPLGGSKGVRTALEVLIEFMLVAVRNQQGKPEHIKDTSDDLDGSGTIHALKKSLALANRITGNESGSLGLHPAVYFYGPTVRHSGPMFMGTVTLIGEKLANNDKAFFRKFTEVRSRLEEILIKHKDTIATILQKHISRHRVGKYASMLDRVILELYAGQSVSESDLVKFADLDGRIVVGSSSNTSSSFSDDAKSMAFIRTALPSSIKCPVCNGYIDSDKSVSYDHVVRRREGGTGETDNCQLTHPYCNMAVKQ